MKTLTIRKTLTQEDYANKGFWIGCNRILDQNGEYSIMERLNSNKYDSQEKLLEIIEEELFEDRDSIQFEYDEAIKNDCMNEYRERYGHLFKGENLNPSECDPHAELRHSLNSWVIAGSHNPDCCQHLALFELVMDNCRYYIEQNLFCMVAENNTWDIVEVAQEHINSFMKKYVYAGGE